MMIAVHAVPASDLQDYMGMPAFKEVGPIQIHPTLQGKLDNFLQKQQSLMKCWDQSNEDVELFINTESFSIEK